MNYLKEMFGTTLYADSRLQSKIDAVNEVSVWNSNASVKERAKYVSRKKAMFKCINNFLERFENYV